MNDSIKARIAAKRAELEKNELAKKSAETNPSQDFSEFSDAIPEVHDEKKSDQIQTHQQFIDSLSIVDVYAKLSGKRPRVGANQVNGIPGFCVAPDHPNTDDEAMQMNRQDNTWVCHGQCEVGSGTVGLVALSMGMKNVAKGQLRGSDYAKAEEQLLKMFGWTEHRGSTNKTTLLPPQPKAKQSPPAQPSPTKKAEPKQPDPVKLASVTNIDGTNEDDDEADRLDIEFMDWRDVIPQDTYAWHYMDAASKDDCVEAFHLGYMLLTLGSVAGRRVMLEDLYDITPNLFITLVGDSGTGKSKASNAMKHVLRTVLPYDPEEEPQMGVQIAGNPSSGGGVVSAFRRYVKVPVPGGKPLAELRGEVKTIIEYGEMEALTSRMSKDTTGLRDSLIALWDGTPSIGTISKGDGENGYYATDPFGCQVTTVQPRNIPNLLTQKDVVSGTLNRYLFMAGEPKQKQYLGKPTLPYFDQAIQDLEEIRDWVMGTSRVINWDQAAADLFEHWAHTVLDPMVKKSTDMLTRADTNIKKIALCFAINSMHEQIEVSDIQAAIKMWPWLASLYAVIDKSVGMAPITQLEEKIISVVKRYADKHKGAEMPIGQVKRALNNNGNKVPSEDMMRALTNLEKMGELRRVPPEVKGPGRPTEKWAIA